jgi:hypothetical protein
MANFDLTGMALKMFCPTNEVITDDKGMPGAYVQIRSQKLSDLLTNGDDSVHPAFLVGDKQVSKLCIGKFEGMAHNNRIYSLPGEDPKTSINLDTYETYCKSKGTGHHCITAAEWAFLALWCKKNGTQPKGNNNYGKDTTETEYVAFPTYYSGTSIGRVATGTGPLTWSHNGQLDGIWDLNGNVWEWVSGLRLVYGELQVIPYNDAADIDNPTGKTSTLWKAVNAAATGWSDLFITPDGSGTTAGSVKLDYVTNHWQWATTITSKEDSSRGAAFASTTASGLSDFCKMYLQAMALLPEDGDTDYGGDYFHANNGNEERCAFRGGSWSNGGNAGVFRLDLNGGRSAAYDNLGGRPAFYE